jgi:hypothetical protein
MRLVCVAVDEHHITRATDRLGDDLVGSRGAVGHPEGMLGTKRLGRQSLTLLDGTMWLKQGIQAATSARSLGQEEVAAVTIEGGNGEEEKEKEVMINTNEEMQHEQHTREHNNEEPRDIAAHHSRRETTYP